MIQSLVLNVRHRAWLSCVPEKQEKSRYEKYRGTALADLPDVIAADYLLDYLMEVGPANSNGMGIQPITYSEIKDWADVTSTEIAAWDAHIIRHLSRAYVNAYNEAKKPTAPAPYMEAQDIETRRKAVVAGFKSLGKRNG